MAATDPFDLLDRALEQTGALIKGVRSDQANLPTPCSGWDVRTLVNHTVYDINLFKTMVNGGERASADVDLIGDNWQAAYGEAADALMETWRSHGADGTFKSGMGDLPASWLIGQHLSDVAVHGWDIARATGQSPAFDPEVGQAALDWSRENLKPQFRGTTFGPQVEVPADAPLYDRLAAFFGRNPDA